MIFHSKKKTRHLAQDVHRTLRAHSRGEGHKGQVPWGISWLLQRGESRDESLGNQTGIRFLDLAWLLQILCVCFCYFLLQVLMFMSFQAYQQLGPPQQPYFVGRIVEKELKMLAHAKSFSAS